MKKFAFTQTVGALALGMVSLGAQAVPTTIDFTSLGKQVLDTAPPNGPITDATPIAVGRSVSNFLFTGAWAWEYDMMRTSDKKPKAPKDGGFILNVNRGGSASDIGLTWAGGLHKDRFLKSISFDIFVTAATPFVTGFTSSGGTLKPAVEPTFTVGDDSRVWALQQTLSFGSGSDVSSLRFGASRDGVIGLDNFNIQFFDATGGGGGGTVPEPASFGLVALALLGAGFATRRRKSA